MMSALGLRAVLAYLDRDSAALAGVVEKIDAWDDSPHATSLPPETPRYLTAVTRVYALIQTWRQAGDPGEGAAAPDSPLAAFSVGRLAKSFAPAPYRDSAQWLCSDEGQVWLAADFIGTVAEFGPQVLLAAGALAARTSGRLFATQHLVCLKLLEMIRAYEAAADHVPLGEQQGEVSEDDAWEFLQTLFPEEAPIPLAERSTTYMADTIALLKRHLSETPAADTTAEQAEQLRSWIVAIRRFFADQARLGRAYHTPPGSHPPRSRRSDPEPIVD